MLAAGRCSRCVMPVSSGREVPHDRLGVDAAGSNDVVHADELATLVRQLAIAGTDSHGGNPFPGVQEGSVRRARHAAVAHPAKHAPAGPGNGRYDRIVLVRLGPRTRLEAVNGNTEAVSAGFQVPPDPPKPGHDPGLVLPGYRAD